MSRRIEESVWEQRREWIGKQQEGHTEITGTHKFARITGDTQVWQGYLLSWMGESRIVGFDDPAGEMWRAWRWLDWLEWRRSRRMKLLRSM